MDGEEWPDGYLAVLYQPKEKQHDEAWRRCILPFNCPPKCCTEGISCQRFQLTFFQERLIALCSKFSGVRSNAKSLTTPEN